MKYSEPLSVVIGWWDQGSRSSYYCYWSTKIKSSYTHVAFGDWNRLHQGSWSHWIILLDIC